MATLYSIHPDNPQSRTIDQIKNALQGGAVMLYPTDTVYAIGCDLFSKSAVQRVRQIKQLSNDKPLTFLCSSLSSIAQYAVVHDSAYRIMRRLIPGPYTFLLPATKLVPKLVMNPRRRTTGIRVPDHPISMALLEALGNPIISTSAPLLMNGDLVNEPVAKPDSGTSRFDLFDCLEKLVDVIVDSGTEPGFHVSTILDLTEEEPIIVRRGLGWEEVSSWLVEAG
ncbi:threonylcarbamoyl-AMP synthase [Kovacikia minuta CCNUW1]|uniref:L-threonylcarbamoyladenylate synthase n=1 Tax=Kovacikia minuta TaxID=2931930 RepID=UPI001CCE1271|nr:L-threonylcarbamoyladenylate synthase [Kovacikia minuta]UBF24651.1 threonylcarbamoyl-AMP synthase [Kovacikia minuta CCNUW1]